MEKKSSNNSLSIIYFVLGAILLILFVLIGKALMQGNGVKPLVPPNPLESAQDSCELAMKTYRNNNEMSCEALKQLEEGIIKMQIELNKLRDVNNNLEKKYGGYDQKLNDLLAFRKFLREQCYIQKERIERGKSGI